VLGSRLRTLLSLNWAFCAALGQELDRPIEGHCFRVVAAPEASVRLTVGHVRAEAAAADDDLLAGARILPDLAERTGSLAPAASLLRLRQQFERLFERDREQLILGLE
jgi:hypothetical protein